MASNEMEEELDDDLDEEDLDDEKPGMNPFLVLLLLMVGGLALIILVAWISTR